MSAESSDDTLSDTLHPPAWLGGVGGLGTIAGGLVWLRADGWEPGRLYVLPLLGLIMLGWGVRQRARTGSWTKRTYMTEGELEEARDRQRSFQRWNLGRLGLAAVALLGLGAYLAVSQVAEGRDAAIVAVLGVVALALAGGLFAWFRRTDRI